MKSGNKWTRRRRLKAALMWLSGLQQQNIDDSALQGLGQKITLFSIMSSWLLRRSLSVCLTKSKERLKCVPSGERSPDMMTVIQLSAEPWMCHISFGGQLWCWDLGMSLFIIYCGTFSYLNNIVTINSNYCLDCYNYLHCLFSKNQCIWKYDWIQLLSAV